MESANRKRFDSLPAELRQQIWRLSLPGPRIITVNHFLKVPLALHINRESRSVALKHYELLHPQHLEHVEHTDGHRCVKGYINFELDKIHMAGLTPCANINRRICHLQNNCWLWQHISRARTFLMTDFAISKFPRLRSYKTVLHFDPNIRGVEYQNLPGHLTERDFQQRLEAAVERILSRVEEIKESKSNEGLDWEPPAYTFVRCELDSAGVECRTPGSCLGYFDTPAQEESQ